MYLQIQIIGATVYIFQIQSKHSKNLLVFLFLNFRIFHYYSELMENVYAQPSVIRNTKKFSFHQSAWKLNWNEKLLWQLNLNVLFLKEKIALIAQSINFHFNYRNNSLMWLNISEFKILLEASTQSFDIILKFHYQVFIRHSINTTNWFDCSNFKSNLRLFFRKKIEINW